MQLSHMLAPATLSLVGTLESLTVLAVMSFQLVYIPRVAPCFERVARCAAISLQDLDVVMRQD